MRIWTIVGLAVLSSPARGAMPAAEQNALVQQYCAVCHSDSVRNGGLSLQHYDAAKRDPVLAAMILSKLHNGAMGAAGKGVPDKAAQQAWLESTTEQASGARKWFVTRQDGVVSAGIVREAPARRPGSADLPVYRIQVTCNPSTRAGEMQLTWSPQAQSGRTMTASVDGTAPIEFPIDGRESMGNGGTAQSGQASLILSDGQGGRLKLANRSLTIDGLFPAETIEFPFSDLNQKTRAELRQCF